eukprot:6239212-Amphidinium_carterae.1
MGIQEVVDRQQGRGCELKVIRLVMASAVASGIDAGVAAGDVWDVLTSPSYTGTLRCLEIAGSDLDAKAVMDTLVAGLMLTATNDPVRLCSQFDDSCVVAGYDA